AARASSPPPLSRGSGFNVPVARRSRARMASTHPRATPGSATVFARWDTEEILLGLPPPVKYDRRWQVLSKMSVPRFQRDKQEKSRPGRYSESVKAVGGIFRMSRQYSIQPRAWAGVLTGSAASAPLPARARHQTSERADSRAKVLPIVPMLVTG